MSEYVNQYSWFVEYADANSRGSPERFTEVRTTAGIHRLKVGIMDNLGFSGDFLDDGLFFFLGALRLGNLACGCIFEEDNNHDYCR